MSTITAAQVKELRERTGLGMMDCKQALVESAGNIDVAIDNLRKSSALKAAKKSGRVAAEGRVITQLGASHGVIVEVNCETDFVARDENFITFVATVAAAAFAKKSENIEDYPQLLAAREALVQKLGENISIRRIAWLPGCISSYVHTNAKIAVLVSRTGGDESFGKDVAMHVAATNPQVVRPEDTPAAVVEQERAIFVAQASSSGKPADIVKKIVAGRVKKYLQEISLTEQGFVKDPSISIAELAKRNNAVIQKFVYFAVGEGIEKVTTDFAAEVRQQAGG